MSQATLEYTVLVVDDDPDIVLGLQDLLDHDGYQVGIARTCAEAISLARQHHYNAVLLDLGLPDGDGSAVLQTLLELHPTLPVIILTAYTATERTIGSLTQGAFAYLTKPFNRDELRAILRRAVGVQALAAQVQHAEYALDESEERFRSLVESATDAIVLADEQGKIISWNKAANKLFGYREEEVRGHPLTMLMPVRYREAHEQGFRRVQATGKSDVIGHLIAVDGLRKDGMEFPLELSLATWKSHGRSFYSGIIRDITARRRSEEALDRLRRQHALILTQAGEGIYGMDRLGYSTFVNTAASTLLGYNIDELVGQPMHGIVHHTRADGKPYPLEDCPIHTSIRDGRVHRVTSEVFWRKDGTSFPVEYISTPIREGDSLAGSVVVFRDVSDRARAEAALEYTEQRFRSLVANIPGAVYRCACDADWTMQFLSEAILNICGYPASDFIDNLVRSYASVIHPEDRLMVQEVIGKAVIAKRPYELEYRVVGPTGMVRWVYEAGQGIFSEDGRLRWLDGVIFDITGRKLADEILQQSETRHRVLFDENPSMYFMVDAQGTVLSVNRFGSERLGYQKDELIGQNVVDIFHPPDREAVRSNLNTCLAQPGIPMSWELRKVRKDGTVIWVRETAQAVRNDKEMPVVLIACEDITVVKEAERALRESEEFKNQILKSSADCIKVLDREGRIKYMNEAGQTLLEIRDLATLMNRYWLSFWEGDDRRAASAALSAANAGDIGKFVGYCATSTGQPKWWDVQVTLMVGSSDPSRHLLVISRDITEYRRVQDALRASEERLERVIHGSNDGFWDGWVLAERALAFSSYAGLVVPACQGDARLIERDEFDNVLESWTSSLHPDDKDRVFVALRAHIEQRVPYDIEYRLFTKTGESLWFHARGQAIWDEQGNRVVRMAGSLQCVADRSVQKMRCAVTSSS